jgi:hypothetical protein
VPYTPALDSVREKILDNLASTLTAIAPPSYASTVATVKRFEGPFEITSYPGICIVPGQETTDDTRISILSHELPVTLVLAVYDSQWREILNKLLADVRVAVLADWTRGGNALTTRVTNQEVVDSSPSQPIALAQMDLVVLYRTLYADPTVAA